MGAEGIPRRVADVGSLRIVADPDPAAPAETSHREDRELMARVGDGQPAARRELARRLLPRVRRAVRAVIGAHVDLEDAVQVSLMEVLRSAKTFRGDSSIETWARRVVVRRTMRFVRRQERRVVVDPHHDALMVQAPVPDSRLVDSLPRPLEAYLDQIPEIHRAALVLRHGFGYSLREIAEMTDAAPNTIKLRLFHGLKKLRKLIDNDLRAMEEEQIA